METPEFLIWAIEHTCPVRGLQDGSDPERTERQLRAARAVSDAHRAGRVFEGLCLDPPDGFRIDDALAVYGGPDATEATCLSCPVNFLREGRWPLPDPGSLTALAGCYGLVPLPQDARPFHEAIERGIEIEAKNEDFGTQPRWYGIWLESPLWPELLFQVWRILDASPIEDRPCKTAVQELMEALDTAYNAGARLHVRLFPRGRVIGSQWHLVPHCPRCQAEWTDAAARQCAVCGRVGHPAPETKRMARGKRPYFPLDRLLGEQKAAEFLVRYEAFRVRQQSPDQAESPPQPEPPDSPPAG
jgi:hypothetical protein